MTSDLCRVLDAIGRELTGLGLQAECLQRALSPGAAEAPASAGAMQALDGITQHLFALGSVLRGLAADRAADAGPVLDAVPLASLQRRLRGLPPVSAGFGDVKAGEVELFEHG